MNCLNLIKQTNQLSSDIVYDLLPLYEYRGKEFYYKDVLEQDFKTINQKQIEKDAFYLGKILNLKITESRMKLLVEKNLEPKNKEEVFIKNLKTELIRINEYIFKFEMIPSDITSLVKNMFKDYENINYKKNIERHKKEGILSSTKTITSEIILNDLLKKFEELNNNNSKEYLQLILSFYVDFINEEIFTSQNETIMMLLLYVMLAQNGFEIVRYTSLFEHIYLNISKFNDALKQANIGWTNKIPTILSFHKTMISILTDMYKELETTVEHYKFDLSNKKTNNLEYIILKGPEIFTKKDIRDKNPYVSDSTIQRTLDRLKSKGLIENLGTGRSAKWIKKFKTEKKISDMEQASIFEMMQQLENN